jgi:hypothetical protein
MTRGRLRRKGEALPFLVRKPGPPASQRETPCPTDPARTTPNCVDPPTPLPGPMRQTAAQQLALSQRGVRHSVRWTELRHRSEEREAALKQARFFATDAVPRYHYTLVENINSQFAGAWADALASATTFVCPDGLIGALDDRPGDSDWVRTAKDVFRAAAWGDHQKVVADLCEFCAAVRAGGREAGGAVWASFRDALADVVKLLVGAEWKHQEDLLAGEFPEFHPRPDSPIAPPEPVPSAAPEVSEPEIPPPPVPRLAVDLGRLIVTFDGKQYDVESVQALRWLNVLAASPGLWISTRDLAERDTELIGARTDRLRNQLPSTIRLLIDSRTGRGSRIRL